MADMFFEDFQVGMMFKLPSRTVTDAHFVLFQALSGDFHPLHADEEYSKGSRFGRRVADGMMLAIMADVGNREEIAHSTVALLRQVSTFKAPVYIGDTINPVMEVAGLEPRRSTGVGKFKTTIRNQKGEVVVETETDIMLMRRGGDNARASA